MIEIVWQQPISQPLPKREEEPVRCSLKRLIHALLPVNLQESHPLFGGL